MAICAVFCRSLSVYLSTGLARVGNGTTARVQAGNSARVYKKVPILLVRAAPRAFPTISSSTARKSFCRGLWQALGPAYRETECF